MADSGDNAALFRLVAGKRTLNEVQGASVEIGTHSSCGFVINDPLVAARHARISHGPSGFVIEDIGSATGTFVDGVSAEGPQTLRDGARIVIGVSRVAVTIAVEAGKSVLIANVEEGRFHFKAKDPEGFQSDPDSWVRSEVRFGRIPLVAGLSWFALVVTVTFLVWTLSSRTGERALSPGAFGGTHAAVFASSVPDEHAGANLRRAHALAEPAGCGVCHSATSAHAMGVDSCATCHADMLRNAHPFRDTPGASAQGRLAADACSMCHSEHEGQDVAGVLASATARAAATACTECHDKVPDKVTRKFAAPTLADHTYSYDPFSHAAHVGGKNPIACVVCHVENTAASGEFAAISFETCQTCHAGSSTDAAIAETLRRKNLVWKPAWHGTDGQSAGAHGGTGCLVCHERLHAADLRQQKIEREVDVVFRWRERGHESQFDSNQCKKCHSDPARLAAESEPRESKFLHALHLPRLDPPADQRVEDAARCATCHAGVANSSALSEQRPLPDLDACKSCHADPAGKSTVLASDERGTEVPRQRPVFPHDRHTLVEGSCFACHAFEGGSDALDARPVTKPEAMSCLPCHADHQNVAQGACQGCHPGESDVTKALFAGRKPVRSNWPGRSFPHFGKGHGALMSKPEGCDACHPNSAMAGARTVTDVQVPPETYAQCRVCHAQRGVPFHWN